MSRKIKSSPSSVGTLVTQGFREAAQQAAARAEIAGVKPAGIETRARKAKAQKPAAKRKLTPANS
jgi:hypothetical protein